METSVKHVKIVTGHVDSLQEITREAGNYIIAVDSGIGVLRRRGLLPDCLIGDLDSAEADDIRWAETNAIEIRRFPAEKDEVDTELALQWACRQNPDKITIYNELNGRFDHTIALVQLLMRPLRDGIPCEIRSLRDVVCLLDKQITLSASHAYVSLFSLTLEAQVTATGLKYAMPEKLYIDKPMGISNEFVDNQAQITVKQGIILLIVSRIV